MHHGVILHRTQRWAICILIQNAQRTVKVNKMSKYLRLGAITCKEELIVELIDIPLLLPRGVYFYQTHIAL